MYEAVDTNITIDLSVEMHEVLQRTSHSYVMEVAEDR